MVDGLKPPQKTSIGKVRLLPRGRVMISDSSVALSYSILSIRGYEADPLTLMTSEVVEYWSPLTAVKTPSAPSTESAVAGVATKERLFLLNYRTFDWCCFYFFVTNSLVALLEALCARIFSLDSWISGFSWLFCFWFVCARSLTWPFFCLSKPGSCAWLSPFLLCAANIWINWHLPAQLRLFTTLSEILHRPPCRLT